MIQQEGLNGALVVKRYKWFLAIDQCTIARYWGQETRGIEGVS